MDIALDSLVASGLRILRVWGFNDVTSQPGSGTVYYQHLSASGSTINTGANGLQRLDYIVSAAEKRGIKLIIPFVNYWDDYGGIAAYIKVFGGSKADWYTNTAAQTQYRKYIQAVVSRYVQSPAIFAWELANEPRCNGCNTDVIFNWASSVSAYVKSLDSNHMVTLGDEGMGLPGDGSYPYQYSEGTDFIKNLGIDTLDFATLHLYPSHWGTSYDWGNAWIKTHGEACAAAGVPCLLEECKCCPYLGGSGLVYIAIGTNSHRRRCSHRPLHKPGTVAEDGPCGARCCGRPILAAWCHSKHGSNP